MKKIRAVKALLEKEGERKAKERRKLEKGLLNWLKQRSLAQLFDGFDCLEETKVDT